MDDRAKPDDPKYLNSPDTALRRKGEQLYGLGAGGAHRALGRGAVPVLVEGPLDAIAVSDVSGYAGLAPCGTALTAAQVDQLAREVGGLGGRRLVTAFDSDPAGRDAALRAYDILRAAGGWPEKADLTAGQDPAELKRASGNRALQTVLDTAGPLADAVVDARLDPWREQLQWAEGRVAAERGIAPLIAALPADQIGRQVTRTAALYGLDTSRVTAGVADAVSRAAGDGGDGGDMAGRAGDRAALDYLSAGSTPAAARQPSAYRASFPSSPRRICQPLPPADCTAVPVFAAVRVRRGGQPPH